MCLGRVTSRASCVMTHVDQQGGGAGEVVVVAGLHTCGVAGIGFVR